MAYFAELNDNNVVTQVISVADEFCMVDGKEQEEAGIAFCKSLFGENTKWVQTSYNTRQGEHLLGKTPLRKNYASPGFIYDKDRNAFYEPRPDGDFYLFDEEKAIWYLPEIIEEEKNITSFIKETTECKLHFYYKNCSTEDFNKTIEMFTKENLQFSEEHKTNLFKDIIVLIKNNEEEIVGVVTAFKDYWKNKKMYVMEVFIATEYRGKIGSYYSLVNESFDFLQTVNTVCDGAVGYLTNQNWSVEKFNQYDIQVNENQTEAYRYFKT